MLHAPRLRTIILPLVPLLALLAFTTPAMGQEGEIDSSQYVYPENLDPEVVEVARELGISPEDFEEDFYGLNPSEIRAEYRRQQRKVRRWRKLPTPEPLVTVDPVRRLITLLENKGVIDYVEAADFVEWYENELEKEEEQLNKAVIIEQVDDPEEIELVKLGLKKKRSLEIAEGKPQLFSSNWAKRLRWGGDIRLRYESKFFDSGNGVLLDPSGGNDLIVNTTQDRHRTRIRVRLGVDAKVNETLDAGVRIATGNEDDPVSTNDTLGDFSTGDTILLDRAYLKWSPRGMAGPLPVKVWAGRMPNPYFSTDLLWDSDLGFEGAAVQFTPKFFPNKFLILGQKLSMFLNVGAFAIQEFELTSDDRWLVGSQFGMQYKPYPTVKAKLAVAYYDYINLQGEPEDPTDLLDDGFLAVPIRQAGNSIIEQGGEVDGEDTFFSLLSDYNMLNVTGSVELSMYDPIFITVVWDWVRNLAFDLEDISDQWDISVAELRSQGFKEARDGYQVGFKVGHKYIQTTGDWRVSLFYKYLESDAVFAAFTDSDFHGGGTNGKGWILKGDVGLLDNLWLTGKWLTTTEIDGPQYNLDTLQVDLNATY